MQSSLWRMVESGRKHHLADAGQFLASCRFSSVCRSGEFDAFCQSPAFSCFPFEISVSDANLLKFGSRTKSTYLAFVISHRTPFADSASSRFRIVYCGPSIPSIGLSTRDKMESLRTSHSSSVIERHSDALLRRVFELPRRKCEFLPFYQ